MAYQVLEVTLISAKDLKRVTLFSKMRVYAVASISGGDPRLPTHRTYADREGGRNPMWQAPLRFTIPPTSADPSGGLALHVLLRAERAFGDRDVGEVFVPVRDLAAAAPERGEQQRHLSYQVTRPVSGRKRGVLHISYRLADLPPAAADAPYNINHKSGSAVTAYPVAGRRAGGPFPPPYQHAAGGYVPSYGGGAFPHHHHQQHHYGGYAGAYGYGGAPHGAPYGYGQGGAAAAAGRPGGGMSSGLGLGLLGGAVGGLMIGDMIADAEVDGGFMDGVGF